MSHSRSPGYEPGNRWIECMRCGKDRRVNEVREDKQKPGLWVCADNRECWDAKHPSEFVRSVESRDKPVGPVFPPPTEVYEDRTFAETRPVPSSTFNQDTL